MPSRQHRQQQQLPQLSQHPAHLQPTPILQHQNPLPLTTTQAYPSQSPNPAHPSQTFLYKATP
ncbi:hypothetical protein DL98DRAFT_512419 [Cadophora sp. DSE1049]|nr:hypothetical protein DL98DRAFT_512419 [Cadophora sp. DSE1049]